MNITVEIKAPELAEAIQNLAATLQSNPIAQLRIGAEDTPPLANSTFPAQADVQNTTAYTPPSTAIIPTAPAFETPHITQPTVAPATPVMPPCVPVTAVPVFSRDQIMTAGAALIDAGKINELMGLFNAFGVQAVTQLKQEQLGAFATELRKLGAQI